MTVVTLPTAEMLDLFGPAPDGVTLEVWDIESPHPRPSSVTGVLIPAYFRGGHRWQYVHDLPGLELLQLPSAGYEWALPHVPRHATLANGRGIHDDETAELAVGLALTSLRNLDVHTLERTRQEWTVRLGRSLAERRVLVVGYGSIGREIAARFEAFKSHVTVVARTAREQDGRQVHAFTELPTLVATADVVVLITPLTDTTAGLMSAELLAAMPDGALLVNVARGGVVDTEALVAELSSGRLFAALDVTDPEPLPAGHPLWTTPNTVLTPHVGGNTGLSVPRTVDLMRRQVAALAAGRPLVNVVEPDAAGSPTV
ncbi:2-hydroxyacid dehydrogenase [Curtobacterium sp. MCBD17_040]|uniref:2-hydroxyacid dehydrogenase n=1 Tax=Curtobacterium sp. MCBD17_040 TaxID=2175674 RepID=UPI000DA8F1CB|nr:2-hydroxyacid dehydrogenase [Curtobacterium sp. MCBD17_040]WIB64182.1 2-hydroxyacid dehydrogenase [Curtobacterium sp. MCBD17_040]